MNSTKYDAFLSYSHSDCGKIAPEIQKGLERIGVSRFFKDKNKINVFRDETNLSASPDLWSTIEDALKEAKYFLLLASPMAAKSIWVEKEVKWWLENKESDKIFIILTKGNLSWSNEKGSFDEQITDSIPSILFDQFRNEPHWIDLREYNVVNDRISYKDTGFKNGLIKVIASITNRKPREIDSEEKKIATRFRSGITSIIFILLSLVLSSVFIYADKKKEEIIHLSNKVWAAGDRISEDNYAKALRLYSYAYAINPDTTTFRNLREFYYSKTIVERFLESSEDSIVKIIDTMNVFAKALPVKLESKYPYYKEEYNHTGLAYFSSLKYQKIVYVDTANIAVVDLKKNQSIDIPFYCNYNSIANNEKQDLAFLLAQDSLYNKVLLSFDKSNNIIDTLWRIGDNEIFFKNKRIEAQLPDFSNIKLADDGKSLIGYDENIYFDHSEENLYFPFWVLNFVTGDIKKKHLKLENEVFEGLSDIQISSYNKYIYLSFSLYGNLFVGYHSLYDIEKQRLLGSFFSTPAGESLGSVLTCFQWISDNSGYLFGRYDGRTIHVNISNENKRDFFVNGVDNNFVLNVENDAHPVHSIGINDSLIVIGATKGTLKFWARKYSEYSGDEKIGEYLPFLTAQLPTNCPIYDILLNNDSILYAIDECGSVIHIDLKQYITLSDDPNMLLNQIKGLYIDDLTLEEKNELGIDINYKIPKPFILRTMEAIKSLF